MNFATRTITDCILILLPVMISALLGVIFWKRRQRRISRQRHLQCDDVLCLRCGYNLRGLDVPRCPECGALRGFTVPMEELGIREEELRQTERE